MIEYIAATTGAPDWLIVTGLIAGIIFTVYKIFQAVNQHMHNRVTTLEGHGKFMEKELKEQTNTINRIAENTEHTKQEIGEIRGTLNMIPCVRGEPLEACQESYSLSSKK